MIIVPCVIVLQRSRLLRSERPDTGSGCQSLGLPSSTKSLPLKRVSRIDFPHDGDALKLQRSRSFRSKCHTSTRWPPSASPDFNEVAPFGASVTLLAHRFQEGRHASTRSLPPERVPLHGLDAQVVAFLPSTKSLPSERVSLHPGAGGVSDGGASTKSLSSKRMPQISRMCSIWRGRCFNEVTSCRASVTAVDFLQSDIAELLQRSPPTERVPPIISLSNRISALLQRSRPLGASATHVPGEAVEHVYASTKSLPLERVPQLQPYPIDSLAELPGTARTPRIRP